MYKELGEQELAKYCSQKDKMAEDELYRRYAARVNSLCLRYLGDDDDAKDLMIETIIQALNKIDSFVFTGEGSLYRWISRIAINKAIDQIRRHRWRTVSIDAWTKDDIPEPDIEEVTEIPKEKLLEWISKLSNTRRAVFNLYCIDGYTHQEIGRLLGISETGSTSILAKARKQLKKRIKDYITEQER